MQTLPALPDDVTSLARGLRRIDQALMKRSPAGQERAWYQGGEPYFDVFVDLEGGRVRWLQVTLRGRSLTLSAAGRLETGRTEEGAVQQGPHPASKIVSPDATPDAALVDLVRRLLQERAFEAPLAAALAALMAAR